MFIFVIIFFGKFVIYTFLFIDHHLAVFHTYFYLVLTTPSAVGKRIVIPAFAIFGDIEHFILHILSPRLVVLCT